MENYLLMLRIVHEKHKRHEKNYLQYQNNVQAIFYAFTAFHSRKALTHQRYALNLEKTFYISLF